MANPSHKYAALAFLNFWIEADARLHETVNSGDKPAKLAAISEAAGRFRIARNLLLKYDTEIGLERYEPVLDIIDDLTADDFGEHLADSVLAIRDKLSSRYGGQNVLSATTKLLWLKLRSPIIIYDQQARRALGTPAGDLHAYYDVWHARYESDKLSIANAVDSLVDVLDYVVNPDVATLEYVSRVAESEWFRHRVMDIYLWNVGDA